jgi:hypothetical protein
MAAGGGAGGLHTRRAATPVGKRGWAGPGAGIGGGGDGIGREAGSRRVLGEGEDAEGGVEGGAARGAPLGGLEKFVMVMGGDSATAASAATPADADADADDAAGGGGGSAVVGHGGVSPATSVWFETFEQPGEDGKEGHVEKLYESEIYTALGLDEMDRDGRLFLVGAPSCTYSDPPPVTGWSSCWEEVLEHVMIHLGKQADAH